MLIMYKVYFLPFLLAKEGLFYSFDALPFHQLFCLEKQQGSVPHRRKHVVQLKRSKAGVKITDTEELDTDVMCSKYDSLSTPEVNKVQAALKSSSLELQAVVKDPLPDALRLAENVMNDRVTRDKKHETSVENQTARDRDAPNPSVNNSIEPTESNDRTHENQSCSNQNNAPRQSLMERNSTAHTYEVPLFMFCCTNLLVCFRYDDVVREMFCSWGMHGNCAFFWQSLHHLSSFIYHYLCGK